MHLVQNRINPLKSDHFVRGISQKDEIIQRKKIRLNICNNTVQYSTNNMTCETSSKYDSIDGKVFEDINSRPYLYSNSLQQSNGGSDIGREAFHFKVIAFPITCR